MNTKLFQSLMSVTLLALVVAVGLSVTPAYADACQEACEWDWNDCYQDAEDWWGQCYDVCDLIFTDPWDIAECEEECDIERENDEDACDTGYTICLFGCRV